MAAEDSDKTEEPTDHKLREARKKGQVFKSQDVISTLMLLATGLVLLFLGGRMIAQIISFTKTIYLLTGESDFSNRNHFRDAIFVVWSMAKILMPLFAIAFIMALVSNVAQVRWLFTTFPLNPSLSKINPVEGFKRIFSMKSLMELAKQTAKLLIVGYICYKVVKGEISKFSYSVAWDLPMTLFFLKKIVIKIIGYSVVAMVIIAVIDYMFQRQMFIKQQRMSIQELKDEYKETEGNPQVKSKIRQLMRQGAMARMMEEVPNSSAVITNPTHLAVALRYIQGKDTSPVVVAKGEQLIAVQIKAIAEDANVPIIENVELAKALFSSCKVGDAIPIELYKAVAEILAYIIKIKRKKELIRKRQTLGKRQQMKS